MIAIPLLDYIALRYNGIKSRFAQDYAIPRQNVNTLIKKGYVVIGEDLYRPMAVRKKK